MLARNGLLPLEAHFAVPLIGGVLVMLNIRLQCGELATILNHSGAKILIGDADLVAPLPRSKAEIPQVQRIVTDYESFLSEAASRSRRTQPTRTMSSPSTTPAAPLACPRA